MNDEERRLLEALYQARETNRRLNRRAQLAESQVAKLKARYRRLKNIVKHWDHLYKSHYQQMRGLVRDIQRIKWKQETTFLRRLSAWWYSYKIRRADRKRMKTA